MYDQIDPLISFEPSEVEEGRFWEPVALGAGMVELGIDTIGYDSDILGGYTPSDEVLGGTLGDSLDREVAIDPPDRSLEEPGRSSQWPGRLLEGGLTEEVEIGRASCRERVKAMGG